MLETCHTKRYSCQISFPMIFDQIPISSMITRPNLSTIYNNINNHPTRNHSQKKIIGAGLPSTPSSMPARSGSSMVLVLEIFSRK
jgi:hypothetical protein